MFDSLVLLENPLYFAQRMLDPTQEIDLASGFTKCTVLMPSLIICYSKT